MRKGRECVSVGKKLVAVLQIYLAADPIPGNCRETGQPGRLLCEVFARDVATVPRRSVMQTILIS